MIIDSFMFGSELDILEGRLEYLNPVVDKFILVESNLTHSGNTKPLHFAENIKRYKKYLHKIHYLPFMTNREDYNFDRLPTHDRDYDTGPWQLENAQRNHIAVAFEGYNADDILLLSDLDEIPHRTCIDITRDYFSKGYYALAVEHDYHAYNFRTKHQSPWVGTAITTLKYAQERGPQGIRNERHGYGHITNGGWHLTWWGTVADIQNKISSFSHQETNQERFKDPNYIIEHMKTGKDIFDRDIPVIEVDSTTIPEDVFRIFGSYSQQLIESTQDNV